MNAPLTPAEQREMSARVLALSPNLSDNEAVVRHFLASGQSIVSVGGSEFDAMLDEIRNSKGMHPWMIF
jgi:hypothetical protein